MSLTSKTHMKILVQYILYILITLTDFLKSGSIKPFSRPPWWWYPKRGRKSVHNSIISIEKVQTLNVKNYSERLNFEWTDIDTKKSKSIDQKSGLKIIINSDWAQILIDTKRVLKI